MKYILGRLEDIESISFDTNDVIEAISFKKPIFEGESQTPPEMNPTIIDIVIICEWLSKQRRACLNSAEELIQDRDNAAAAELELAKSQVYDEVQEMIMTHFKLTVEEVKIIHKKENR